MPADIVTTPGTAVPADSGRDGVESVIAELTKMRADGVEPPGDDDGASPEPSAEEDATLATAGEKVTTKPTDAKAKPASVQIAAVERARKDAAARLDSERRAIVEERRRFETERSQYDTSALKTMLRRNPIAFFKEMGLASDHQELGKQLHSLAQQAYAEALGDKAPPELKEAREKWSRDQRVIELEQKLENYQRAEQERRDKEEQAKAWSEFRGSVRKQLQDVSDDLPHLKRLASKRTDDVLDDVTDIVERYHAKQGEVPELNKVFEYLEGRLAALVASDDEEQVKKPPTAKPKAGTKSLSNEVSTSTRRHEDPEDHDEMIRLVQDELRRGVVSAP